MPQSFIQYGIDVILQKHPALKKHRTALLTNNAATNTSGEQSRAALLKHQFHLVKLFAPEHGITVTGADGVAQPGGTDAVTNLPVISLYNNKLAPTEEDLNDVDVILFDIPDVGCRFYTYLWTMTHVMEACAQYNKPFIVLDRPNPIGALIEKTEGPFLDEASCSSFIGRWNIPLKHGCTLGELALYFAATRLPSLNIEVIKAENYQRLHNALHDFAFTPTSPAIQNIHTALLYPGMGLLEGVQLNEARGTAHPFTMFGAPWINAKELLNMLVQQNIPGITFETVSYKAVTPPYENETCNGVRLIIKDAAQLMAVQTGITVLQTLAALYPQQLQPRLYKTAANPSGEQHLDKLVGLKNSWQLITQQQHFNTNCAGGWWQHIHRFHLYK
jgi:uncharacterized protein YbbC (DUF1343 family)